MELIKCHSMATSAYVFVLFVLEYREQIANNSHVVEWSE